MVKTQEFIRRLRRYARNNDLPFELLKSRGKGDHGMVKLGGRITTVIVGRREMSTGTMHGICKQLGVDPKDL